MWWIDALVVILQIFLAFLYFAGKKHLDVFIEKYYAREKAFETESGRTEAIGKAIDNVLKELEIMKATVSLEEQRRHKIIEGRNSRLINLVQYSEELNLLKVRLVLAITNESDTELYKVQSSLHDVLVSLRVDSLTLIAIYPEITDDSVTKFGDCLFKLGNEILTIVTNAISLHKTFEKYLNFALNMDDGVDKIKWLENAKQVKDQFSILKEHKYIMQKDLCEIEQKYFMFLRDIFGNDMILQRTI